jgi:thioredoxin 1
MSFSRVIKSTYLPLRPSLRAHTRAFHVSAQRSVLYKNASADTFTKAIAQKDRVAVVDFYADWCGPCRTLTPVLEKLTAEPSKTNNGLAFDLLKVDIDTPDGQSLAAKYQVAAVPTVYAFLDNVPIDKFQGALPEPSVKRFLEQLATSA